VLLRVIKLRTEIGCHVVCVGISEMSRNFQLEKVIEQDLLEDRRMILK
jgi:hypothetical protein